MRKNALLLLVLLLAASTALASTPVTQTSPTSASPVFPVPSGSSFIERIQQASGGVLLSSACCRVCTTGKACGNSCINRNYTCRQPPGCACNGY